MYIKLSGGHLHQNAGRQAGCGDEHLVLNPAKFRLDGRPRRENRGPAQSARPRAPAGRGGGGRCEGMLWGGSGHRGFFAIPCVQRRLTGPNAVFFDETPMLSRRRLQLEVALPPSRSILQFPAPSTGIEILQRTPCGANSTQTSSPSACDSSRLNPKPRRVGCATGGPPLSTHRSRNIGSAPVLSMLQDTSTRPAGVDNAPYLAAFVVSS